MKGKSLWKKQIGSIELEAIEQENGTITIDGSLFIHARQTFSEQEQKYAPFDLETEAQLKVIAMIKGEVDRLYREVHS